VQGIPGTIELKLLCYCLINKTEKICVQTNNFALKFSLCAHAHICVREKLVLIYKHREEHSSVWECGANEAFCS